MRSNFYPKIAVSNIRKNNKIFVPYLSAAVGTIMMFYMLLVIILNPGIETMPGRDQLRLMLVLGEIIVGVFAVIFLFYTNSFLMKRRKKELGLYSILGLEKRHIGRILFFEVLYCALFCMAVGIFAGTLFARLMFMVLLKMTHTTAEFSVAFAWQPVRITVLLFGFVFLITFLSDLFQIGKVRPIELLQSDKKGEKEPKARWILALLGFLLLGWGYYIALSVETPSGAIVFFFAAVLLVMGGTYLLFTTGSIAVLKFMKKNKAYYYKPRHFTTISGMLYRMKQNAVGLANICILSTGVLLAISTTVSLNAGTEELMRSLFPNDVCASIMHAPAGLSKKMKPCFQDAAEEAGVELTALEVSSSLETYRIRNSEDPSEFLSPLEATGMYVTIRMTDLAEYNESSGTQEQLAKGEVLIGGNLQSFGEDQLTINKHTFRVKGELDSESIQNRIAQRSSNSYVIVFADRETLEEVTAGMDPDSLWYDEYIGADIEGGEENIDKFMELAENMPVFEYAGGEENAPDMYYKVDSGIEGGKEIRAFISGFLFIGIFIGVLFLMATALIIYYKQISEGYEDRERFIIMQQVGMSLSEVKKCIHSQILTVFFLPLVVAVIHICVAFNIITKLLWIFGLYNTMLFMGCTVVTILIFGVVYTVVFSLTSRTYVKIVGME